MLFGLGGFHSATEMLDARDYTLHQVLLRRRAHRCFWRWCITRWRVDSA